MKILICCTTETWGGLEQTAFRDALNLRKMGVETAIFCLDRGAIYEKAKENNIEVHTLPPTKRYFSYSFFKKIKKLCSSGEFDLVHVHSFNTIFSLLLGLKGVNIPVVATRHIYVEHVKKDLLHKWYLGRIDKMLAISDFSKQNILDTYPISEDKIETLYLGIDLNKHTRDEQKALEFKEKFNIDKSKKIVGVIGRIDPAKGQMEFIESIPDVIQERQDVHFVIVGKTTSQNEVAYLDKLRTRIQELSLNPYVSFTGFFSDVSVPLSALDVFVMPSYFEAFGLIAIEAMACKVPVIATDMGSISEIIPDGTYGIKILPKNSSQIAEAIKKVLSDEALSLQMSAKAYKMVQDKFDDKKYFNRLKEVYSYLLKESSTNLGIE